jgi:rare lipoprotein A
VSVVGQRNAARTAAGGASVSAGRASRVRLILPLALIASFAILIAACGRNNTGLGERVIPLGQPVPKGGGVYLLGKPYEVAGIWYTPREDPGYNLVGRASWYGELFHGRRTANGEIYDMDRLSAASPTLPLPVYALVTNLANGRTIVVRVNDRGPYANDRILDLSRRSAEVLGFRGTGTALVRVKYLGRAPLSGDDSYEQRFLANQTWMRVAAKDTSGKAKAPTAAIANLPLENPENLETSWKKVAPVQSAAAKPATQGQARTAAARRFTPAEQSAASSYGWTMVAAPSEAEAIPSGAPLYWQASPLWAGKPEIAETGSLPPPVRPTRQAGGFLIQAGSFKNRDNANRARAVLVFLAPVEVAEIEAAGDVFFRVRVGPFSDQGEAAAALAKVTQAGYQGARIIVKN